MTSLVIDLIVSYPVSKMIHASVPASTKQTWTSNTLSLPPPPPPQPQQSTRDLMLLKRIGELGQHMADLIQDNLALEERLDKHGTRLYNLENLNIPHKVSQAVNEIVTDVGRMGNAKSPLRAPPFISDLPAVDMKEILQQRMFEDKSYEAHEDHKNLFDALQKSLERDYSNQLLADLDEAHKKKIKRRESPRTPPGSPHSQPPPLPPPVGASGAPGSAQQHGNKVPSSSKTAASTHQYMAWTTSDTRYESTGFTAIQETSPSDDLMHDDSIPDKHVHFSDDEDSENDHLPKDNVRKDWWKPLPEEEIPATPEPAWTIPSSNVCHSTLVPDGGVSQDAHRSEYLRYGVKGISPALSISKIKAASYPDFGLELLVPEQMWIDDVCTYDISAKYGISHWWFNRQKFYIDIHDSPSCRKEVRTHMLILSVVRIKAYSRYGYDYLSEIILRRANFQEHTIAEKDFKNLYPSDFEDLNLLLLQGHLDHLLGSDKRMLSTAVKL
ncbi:hypothetical protein Tco_0174530 [Tanacetum coccineum]